MRRIVVLALALFVVQVGMAEAGYYVEYPTIHERAAEEDAAQFLHKNYATWRYREEGYIDCRGGRLNRITWACRVGWIKGHNCWLGRMQIQNEDREGSTIYYNVHFRARRC
jgi:hypothetical protein